MIFHDKDDKRKNRKNVALVNKKEVISFRYSLGPGQNIVLSEMVKADGTVEGLKVRFYSGQQKALHIYPYIKHKGDKHEPMVTFSANTDQFLSGDDSYFEYSLVAAVENEDQIVINATNTDNTYTYSVVVDVTIDYYAGTERVIGGVIHG